MTWEQFLAFDEQSEDKHEYDGEFVIPLSRANRGEENLWYYRRQSGRPRASEHWQRLMANVRRTLVDALGEAAVTDDPEGDADLLVDTGDGLAAVCVRAADRADRFNRYDLLERESIGRLITVSSAHPKVEDLTRINGESSWQYSGLEAPATMSFATAAGKRSIDIARFFDGVPLDHDSFT